MRIWRRSHVREACGRCGRSVTPGQPFLEIQLAELPRSSRKVRCVDCAGEPVPINVPPADPVPTVQIAATVKRSAAAKRPLLTDVEDFKARQMAKGDQ